MLNRIVITNKFKPESLHIVRYEGVITNPIPSQAFLFGEFDMKNMKRFIRNSSPLCACGCGKRVKWWKLAKTWGKFIKGHNPRNISCSEETKLKISIKNTGNKHTEETKRKLSIANKGKKLSEETKRKISLAGIGRKHSEESKLKMSLSAIGKIISKEAKKKMSLSHQNMTEETKRKMSLSHTGKKCSEETKKKMSKAGKNRSEEIKRRVILSLIGRKCSKETREKISESLIGRKRPLLCGENHPNWKGGISCDPYCDIWGDQEYRNDILSRDNHICQNSNCWHTTDHLPINIHHIDYDKLNCPPWNLITVCHSCNSRANHNRNYWTDFYQNILFRKYDYKVLGLQLKLKLNHI